MRVLMFTKYSSLGASSRYRAFQYIPLLRQHGIECTIQPLLDDNYLKVIYGARRDRLLETLLSRYLFGLALVKRLFILRHIQNYDLVYFEYEILPFLPPIVEEYLAHRNIRTIVDFDDPIFATYEFHTNPLIRLLLKGKIGCIMQLANAVIVANSYLETYARRFSKNVFVVPTVVDLSRYTRLHRYQEYTSEPPILGWIGTPVTSKYLQLLAGVLRVLAKSHSFSLRVVGDPSFRLAGIRVENRDWSMETEVDEIAQFSIGLMPLPDDEWTRGKSGLKLIQYMACGVCPLASPVGVNTQIIQNGRNGFLASSESEWLGLLSLLLTDELLRQDAGIKARETVEKHYSLQSQAPTLIRVFEEIAGGGCSPLGFRPEGGVSWRR